MTARPASSIVPAVGLVNPEQRAGDFGAAAADESAKPHDLTRPHGEGNIVESPRAREPLYFEKRRAMRSSDFRIERAERPPNHQLNGAVRR